MSVGIARLGLIAALAVTVSLVCWPSSVLFADKWVDTASLGYTHGWLVLLICLWLIWRNRAEIAIASARPAAWAFPALALTLVAWLVCYRASIETLELPLVPLIFLLAGTAALGKEVGRLLLFPVAFFYFAVPTWYSAPLRFLTVQAVHVMLKITGPRAVFAGDLVQIPGGSFVIEEGCSGLHFMIVGLAVAALYGELERDTWPVRLRQLALMAALALLANWIRVYTVIEAGYLTNMQSYLVRVSHYGFGWCVFAVALLLYFWLVPRLRPAGAAGQQVPTSSTDPALSAASVLPVLPPAGMQLAGSSSSHPGRELIASAAAAAIMIAVPALSALARSQHPAPHGMGGNAIDPPSPWRRLPLAGASAWSPQFPGADRLQLVALGDGAGRTIELLSVSYRAQRDGAELVGESASLFGANLEPRTERRIDTSAGAFHETEVSDRTQARSLIWWRYRIGADDLLAPFAEQLWYGLKALVWNPSAELVAMRTDCRDDCAEAHGVLSDFVSAAGIR